MRVITSSSPSVDSRHLQVSLFLLRMGVFVVMFFWSLDKLVQPEHTRHLGILDYDRLTMSTVLETADEVRERLDQDAFNIALWKKLLADPTLASLPYGIETDEHGQMIMSPPPAPSHGGKQSEIARRLGNWNPGDKVLTECPISTSRGVKVADVAWRSLAIWEETQQEVCFLRSPEICVEVLSGN